MSFETLNANCNGQNRVILKHGSHLEAWILWLPFLLVKAKILNKNPLCQKGTTEKKKRDYFFMNFYCAYCVRVRLPGNSRSSEKEASRRLQVLKTLMYIILGEFVPCPIV